MPAVASLSKSNSWPSSNLFSVPVNLLSVRPVETGLEWKWPAASATKTCWHPKYQPTRRTCQSLMVYCPVNQTVRFPQFSWIRSSLSRPIKNRAKLQSSESPKNYVAHLQIVIINYPCCTLVNRPLVDVMITSNLKSNSSQMPGQTLWSIYPFWFHLSRQSSKTRPILKIVILFRCLNSLRTISYASKPVSAPNIYVCPICSCSANHAQTVHSQTSPSSFQSNFATSQSWRGRMSWASNYLMWPNDKDHRQLK